MLEVNLPLDPDLPIFWKYSSTLHDRPFFHNLAHILGKNWLDLRENFTQDVSLNKEVARSTLTEVCAFQVLLLYRRALSIILSISCVPYLPPAPERKSCRNNHCDSRDCLILGPNGSGWVPQSVMYSYIGNCLASGIHNLSMLYC